MCNKEKDICIVFHFKLSALYLIHCNIIPVRLIGYGYPPYPAVIVSIQKCNNNNNINKE